MRKYFIAGDKLLAFNAKCCTTSLVRQVIKTYHPEAEEIISNASYPEGITVDTAQHHRWCPARINPDRPVIVVIRDPVERFRSAMAQVGLTDADAILQEFQDEAGNVTGRNGVKISGNIHFLKQTRFEGDITYYRMDNVNAAAAALGLETPLPHANEAAEKPTLTAEQEAAVRAWYAEDQALWDSLA